MDKFSIPNFIKTWYSISSDYDFTLTVLQNIPVVRPFINKNPWAIFLMIVILPILLVWREIATNKLHPFLFMFESLPKSAQKVIAKSEKFHKAFAQIFEVLVKECNSEKQVIYENFIGNLILYVENESDSKFYSKMILTLLNLTPEECEIFKAVYEDLLLGSYNSTFQGLNNLLKEYDKETLEQSLIMLQNYGLIRLSVNHDLDKDLIGIIHPQCKTNFSDIFYKYIK